MKQVASILTLMIFSALLVGAQTSAESAQKTSPVINSAQVARELERFIDELAKADRFSGAVLVVKGTTPIIQKVYGQASKSYNIPNRLDTKFNLGSMNKMFTAVAVAQLAEQGKLSFEDTVGKHLPDYSNKQVAQKVTIHQLLTHTSGMGSYFNNKFQNSSRAKFREVRDYFPLFVDEPLEFEPGTRWSYSNSGFMLLGAIVEKVSGENYFDYIREHIYKPAGMINSDSYELDRETPNLAIGYTRMGPSGSTERRNNIFMHVLRGGPAGGGYSTVEDLIRFAMALKNHKLLSAKYTEIVLTGKVDIPGSSTARYAYGFQEEKVNGQRRVGHGGGFPGINSELQIYPELDYTVAVMSNYDPPAASRIADRVGKLLTGAPIPIAINLAPAVLKKYENRYAREGAGPGPNTIDVVSEGAGVWLILDGQRHKFLPKSETEFYDEDFEDVVVTFTKDDKGEITALKLVGAGPGPLLAHKVTLPAASLKGNTTFRVKGFANAHIVELAGSFNNWTRSQLLFANEGSEWIARIDLQPGKHTYKFIVDGEWIVDPANPATEDDGHGNTNSVLIIK